jgi:hypothetical protein
MLAELLVSPAGSNIGGYLVTNVNTHTARPHALAAAVMSK